MWVARITMLALTVFGVAIALSDNQSIFRVVSYAWAGLGACFGPLILFSLFWKRTTFPAAVAGMLSGGVVMILRCGSDIVEECYQRLRRDLCRLRTAPRLYHFHPGDPAGKPFD